MFSSSPQTCHYYNNSTNSTNNDNGYKTESSILPTEGRYNHDTKSSQSSGNYMASDSSWHHLDHDYTLDSPTPTTSPSFPLQQYSSMLTPPTSTPSVLSHAPGAATATTLGHAHHQHHHQSDITPPNSSGGPGTPSSLPSYGYGLSHRGFLPRPKLTTTLWEDERTVCFQVDANGICVARREDNDMINGTKLLNVAGMSRGKRDGILKNEKGRVVVKVGAMHLKGVWITFDRAKTLSAQFKIQDMLYPLFVDNPQTFLYSHPITSPISRLGSFRPFYPSSWDRTLPSASSSSSVSSITSPMYHHYQQQQQHGIDLSSSSDTHHVASIPAPFAYRPGLPPGGSPLTPQSSTSYGGRGNTDLLSMDYRSAGTTSDSLTDQGNPSSSSASHGTPYYNDLLSPNTHRSNDEVPFYGPSSASNNRVSSPVLSTNNGNNTLLNNHDPSPPPSLLDSTKRSADVLPPTSAFQSLDTPTFHPPLQSLYMDSVSTTSPTAINSKDPSSPLHHHHQQQQQQQIYLPNPAHNSILNNILPSHTSMHLSSSSSDNTATISNNNNIPNDMNGSSSSGGSSSASTSNSDKNNNNNMDPPPPSSRRNSLIMNHFPRNNTQRHHPYANNTAITPPPPKLSSLQDQLSLPHLYTSNINPPSLGHSGSAASSSSSSSSSTSTSSSSLSQLKKPSTSSRHYHHHRQYSPSRLSPTKEVDTISIKHESDHSSRPW